VFQNLDIFRMAQAMSQHAATRQALSARNMANADTPGYAAQDLPRFADIYDNDPAAFGLRATRDAHLNSSAQTYQSLVGERVAERNPNGNSVSLETEMLEAVNAKRQHDRAVTIYKTSLGVLRTAIGRP